MFKLSKIGGLISDGIVTSMRYREKVLLQNKVLLAAIYVDPMNRVLLNEEQQECDLVESNSWIRVKGLKSDAGSVIEELEDDASSAKSSSSGED